MEPIIYNISTQHEKLEINKSDIYFDHNPSPKLIKYGFNNIIEQIDMIALTKNDFYKAGLNFDFDRKDEKSIVKQAATFFPNTDINEDYAEIWELFNIFGLIETSQVI